VTFSHLQRPCRLRDPASLLLVGNGDYFPRGKAAEMWSWPFPSTELKNACSYTSTAPYTGICLWLGQLRAETRICLMLVSVILFSLNCNQKWGFSINFNYIPSINPLNISSAAVGSAHACKWTGSAILVGLGLGCKCAWKDSEDDETGESIEHAV
jgi:hypothetical protein